MRRYVYLFGWVMYLLLTPGVLLGFFCSGVARELWMCGLAIIASHVLHQGMMEAKGKP